MFIFTMYILFTLNLSFQSQSHRPKPLRLRFGRLYKNKGYVCEPNYQTKEAKNPYWTKELFERKIEDAHDMATINIRKGHCPNCFLNSSCFSIA